jgi:hypothetical protein
MKSSLHSLITFLPFSLSQLRLSSPGIDPILDITFQMKSSLTEFSQLLITDSSESESESDVTTDSQSASLSWNKAPSGAYDQIFIRF